MRLAQFIESNMEAILSEWDAFAKTLLPASDGMDMVALRDHAEEVLRAAVADLSVSQSSGEQRTKSLGLAPRPAGNPESAAETHGMLRATGGFTLQQLVAEYRAVRASVLRLWAQGHDSGPEALRDMTRFNEAIDQAVAESVDFFAAETERWRNVFLGVLGHDLRGPLNAILMTSQLLSRLDREAPVDKLASRLINGGERMRQLLDDLLDYSRASLELGIPVFPAPVDLARVCEEEVELQRAVWLGQTIELVTAGAMEGSWDASRMKQVLGNLISNAAKYGDQGATITVRLSPQEGDLVALCVENAGPPIAINEVKALFEPLQRAAHCENESERTSLGLGLFIVRHIVRAHGGMVSLASEAGRTTFTVTLPRNPPRPD